MTRPPRSVLILSIALFLGLAGLAGTWFLNPSVRHQLARIQAPEVQVPSIPAFTGQPALDALVIRDKALFYVSRNWIPPPPPPIPPPAYQLASVMVLPEGKSIAIVKSNSGGTTLRLHLRDPIEGWSVEDITVDHVLLNYQNQHAEILPVNRPVHVAGLMKPASAAANGPRALGNGLARTTSAGSLALGGARLYQPPPTVK
jgi:hypothetical protein